MPIKLKRLAPVLVVPAVEPSLEFFRRRLGFNVTIEVPLGNALGFAALEKDGIEVMLQSRESIGADMPKVAGAGGGEKTFLYIEVGDLDAVIAAVEGAPVVLERRRAFYGADEIAVREPGGHVVCFSSHAAS
jgi:catechol 2,3-dioxygenase-like lactoylglutathione lyase family enzyme